MKDKIRYSESYIPFLKTVSENVKLKSHKYLLRAGMIRQCGSGLYTFLPLGLKVLRNIEAVIREELNRSGLLEMLMPCVQPAKVWQESGRYGDYGQELLKFKDRHDHELLFGPTNEELITSVIKDELVSYKQLPRILYHIQWKFRDEIRPRFGLMRAREFLMQDAYSFDVDYETGKKSYDVMYQAYLRIFKKLGLSPIPCKADAGVIGGQLNHEFHIIPKEGAEGEIFYPSEMNELVDQFCGIDPADSDAIDIATTKLQSMNCCTSEAMHGSEKGLLSAHGVEVGHIFLFGDKYSAPMNAQFLDKNSRRTNLYMGSYGIGVSRLLSVIVEIFSDNCGIIWPELLQPFQVGLLNLHKESKEIADSIFDRYRCAVFYDDVEDSPGAKFARMALVGLSKQVIVSRDTMRTGMCKFENRVTGEISEIPIDSLFIPLS